MSYSLIPYLVDLDQLRTAVGSKDEALLAAIATSNPDAFQGDEDDDEITVGQALRHLVTGEAPDTRRWQICATDT
jgi:hypothetical protein